MKSVRAAVERSGFYWLRIRGSVPLLLEILTILLCMFTSSPAFAQSHTKTVLVMYSFTDYSTFGRVDVLESAMRARVPWPVDFYVESFEGQRFDNEEYEQSVAETLKHTYSGRKLDLVMVAAYPALQFALRHRDELFPGVPIVFFAVEARRLAGQKLWPGVTGVTDMVDMRATIDLALSLHPASDTVAIIGSNSAIDRYWLAALHGDLLRYHDKVKEIDLFGLPAEQLFEKIAALPSRTVVLLRPINY
jgi:ABC-type uncharacterized transport system substrate-binding protein